MLRDSQFLLLPVIIIINVDNFGPFNYPNDGEIWNMAKDAESQ